MSILPPQTVKVKFHNTVNPFSSFDFLLLEDLMRRKDIDHDMEKLHRVEFFIILVVTNGSGYHTIDFTDYKYGPRTVLTIRKDQIQKFSRNNSLEGFLLIFQDEFLVSYLEDLEAQKSLQLFNELLASPKIQLNKKEFATILNIVQRMETEYFKVNDDYSQSIIRSELHILITKLYRIKSQNNPLIKDKKYLSEFIEFQSHVEQNVNRTNKVIDYAKMMGLSTKTLNTVTRSIANKPAKAFIDDICVKQIKRLLINTPLSIKETAYASGFEETTNFYKYFKKHVGTTPENFRSAH